MGGFVVNVQFFRNTSKVTKVTCLFACLLGVVFAYALGQDATYEPQTMVIIPDTVTGEGWVNHHNVSIQDVRGGSIYQDFSLENSATLRFLVPDAQPDASSILGDVQVNESSVVEPGSETDGSASIDSEVSPEAGAVSEQSVSEENEIVEPEVSEEPATENSSPVVSEPATEVPAVESPTSYGWQENVFALASQQLLAQAIIDESVESSPEPEPAQETFIESPASGEVQESPVPGIVSEEQSPPEEEVVLTEEDGLVPMPAPELSLTGDSVIEENALLESPEPERPEQTADSLPPCESADGCSSEPLVISGFLVPEFDTAVTIDVAQLRLSLAAKLKSDAESDIQRVVVEYTYNGELWDLAQSIEIEEEISNGLNGGYYLISMRRPPSLADLANLQVRLTYQGDVSELEGLFVESAWLELISDSFYEPPENPEALDAINYERELILPTINEFVSPVEDFAADEPVSFELQYDMQKNILAQLYTAVVSENEFAVDEVVVYDPHGNRTDIDVLVEYGDDNKWTLSVARPPQKFLPGKYKVELTFDENERVFSDEFEFYWGVLAINTTKSIYEPGETATLNLAALTKRGDTICDADLRLQIISPSGTISDVPVERSGACGPNNVTDIPDYLATYRELSDVGRYEMQLSHYNISGNLVHKVSDSFEVREYVPYVIERNAPTRIYPPAPYDVKITIKANRTFSGAITERLPLGFVVLESSDNATLATLDEYNELIWNDIVLEEGETKTLSYRFDAPDVSPYLYLLGPLNLDGFEESRQWQIASDALGGVAWLTGFQTDSGTDLNAGASRMLWSTSTVDGLYFSHATSSESYKLTVEQTGDYLVAVTIPQQRTDGNSSRTRIGAEVRVNGVAVPNGLGRSGYIRNTQSHSESSTHVSFMLNDLAANDFIEVYVEGLTTIDAADNVVISGQAGLYVEHIAAAENIFYATTTRTASSTNLNGAVASALQWTEIQEDSGFVHSNSVNSQNITLTNAGNYFVSISIPLSSAVSQQSVLGRVRLNGVQIPSGIFAQGYAQDPGTESDGDSSIHWSGVVVATTSNMVLTVTTEQEAAAGTVTVTAGFSGSIYIQELPTTDIIVLRGTDLSAGTDWSDTPAESVLWNRRDVYDATTFTHSTTTNSDDIVVNEAGDYFLVYNNAMTSVTARANNRITVTVNGNAVSGAQTKSHYIRNQSGHNNSSGSLIYLLTGLTAGQTINILSEQEGNAATMDDTASATVMLWKKAELNIQPDAPTLFDTPFDNVRFSSTTPYFDFSAIDPDGTSEIQYEISWSTTTSFIASTTRVSGINSGFTNTASSTDTSPFVEGNRVRFQVQAADTLAQNTTYYWRVRARDATGSGNFGDWSPAQSMTLLEGTDTPEWFQTFDDQFRTNVLTTTQVSGNNSVEVAVPKNEEVLLAYAESTNTTLQYRLWDGTNLGVELDALNVGGVINWVVTAAGTTRDEYVVGTLDNSNDVNFMVFNRASSTWGNLVEFTTTVSNATRRGLAVAYETGSGEAVAVSCDGDADPSYRVWNGSSWYATGTINVSSANNCELITMASDPTSNEIVVVVRDINTQYEAQVWDGDTNTWGNAQVLGSMPAADAVKEGLSVAYETSGNQAMVVTTNAGNNNFLWNTWNGTSWGGINSTQAIDNDFENGRLISDPSSDRITLCYIDEDAAIGAITWDGDAWLAPRFEFTISGNDDRGRAVDCEYESLPGRGGYIIGAYGDTGVDGDYHAVYNGASWTSNLPGSDINDAFWVQTEKAENGIVLALHFDDETDDIDFTFWNGTSWSAHDTIEDTPSSVTTPNYETGSMAARRYVSETGTIRSQPIRHTAVPGQPTWGDLYFNTTETLGTNVTVKVFYSSTTACDTVIPDAALAGNQSGFDVSASPVNLSGLSTTTYDEICLEATLTQNGGTSPTLNDWRVTWERTPFLTQNYFRWYVNGSFLTPTDVWPLGVSALGENVAIDSTAPVDLGEEVRLRMSLNNENVLFATSTDTFKLQYGIGASCPAITKWSDVGAIGSSTAAWRGYANSIVGSDWYNSSWSRRIKLTIDNSVVPGSVTDFPVYVDLSDLPANFFSTVQSDGDDIRITQSDGITELPFDLVSINTGTNVGELHFRANLSSTTDSEFYIYYGNGSASGYAPSATYGAQNVWTNSYSLRYALDDNPTGASPQFIDSTSNSNDAVARPGMTAGDVVAGRIGNAINLDGNDGGVFQSPLAYTGPFSISFWMRSQVITDGDGFMVAGPAGAFEKFGTWTGGTFFTRVVSASDTAVTAPADGTWSHVVLTRDSSNKVDLYVNGGAPTRLFADAAQAGTSDWENFGGETTQGFEGDMDELRFASVRRDAGWVGTEYNNQSNPTGFYTLSGEELMSDGRRLPTTLLSVSDVAQTYEEQNPTALNFGSIPVGADAEWDFVLENNNASTSSEYCFRLTFSDGQPLDEYAYYPKLTTNAPPPAPALAAPFDNERVASSSPFFEFSSDDVAGDDVTYQIQIDDDQTFTSVTYDQASDVNGLQFENIIVPSDKDPFTSGQTVRYIPPSGIATGTYWWRVRAKDPNGSNSYGAWSTAYSFTIDTTITATTWFQTTGEQFDTNALEDATSSPGTDDLAIAVGFTNATITSTGIDFDDGDAAFGNAWGSFSFNDNETVGDIKYSLEYRVSGDTWALIPDSALAGNSSGYDTSPVSLITLDTTLYNEIRIRGVLTNIGGTPRLLDWTVSWGYRVAQPTLDDPFDNAKVATVTPTFTFITTDPEGDVLQYEFSISTTTDFTASTTFLSGVSSGFLNTVNASDTSPFNSGEEISFTLPGANALVSSTTYWWRVRARDPLQSNLFSFWSKPQSFTVDESIASSVWFQTTGEQFRTNSLNDIEGNTTLNRAEITTTLREVMTAYGEGTVQSPRYRLWDGTEWGAELTAQSVGAQIEQTVLKASPTRNEYALGTVGTDGDMGVQIYDGSSGTWGDQTELVLTTNNANMRSFDLAYEDTSGDLMAVSCAGTEAVYRIWNGSSWSATTSISLTNPNNCLWVKLASDPISDEIIAVFRHTNTGVNDFEAIVWNGSSWGNARQFGELNENAHEGMAVGYEESGNQAVVVVSNDINASFLFNIWNGSAWSGTSTHALPNDFEWGEIATDVGTDNLVLCYIDEDSDLGIVRWTGSAPWQSAQEFETLGNSKLGRPVSCQFETNAARDGYIMIPYSDDGAGGAGDGGKYQVYATSSLSGELDISTIEDSYNVISTRGGDGVIHAVFLDDTADDYVFTNWNGTTWAAPQVLDTNPSVTDLPFHESVAIAARQFPAFTGGSMRSTLIDFDDGTGPRWERLRFSATTPGSSNILYQVYYNTGTSTVLVPDSLIPGNSIGFSSSTVDISNLNKNIYNELYLDATFTCVAGNCPVLNDWSVEWAEGIDISGNAYQYNGVTPVTSGTVAVAVNGVRQVGKTGTISGGGTWIIDNVTAFEGDTVLVFIDGAADASEAVAVARYDGIGDITGLELSERHLTLGSNDAGSTTNSNLEGFEYTDDEDVFFSVTNSDLTLCADVGCHDARLKIKSNTRYQPGSGADTVVHDFINYGEFVPNGNTLRLNGSWYNYATVTMATSTVIFTATSSSEILVDASTTHRFYNVTFGETSGSATWTASTTLDVDGDFAVDRGTLARGTSTITIARNARIGVGGGIMGLATTTFDGSGSFTWTDNTASGTNLGRVVIDGTAKIISLASQVAAQSITIGVDDTLTGGSFNTIVYGPWTNNGTFAAGTGGVSFNGTSTFSINRGASAFNNLSFGGVNGIWAFTTPTLDVNGNFTIATGTVTLPSATTTIAGSFLNTGGTFQHNNGTVVLSSAVAGRSITQRATSLHNAFFNLWFTGSGSWSYTESAATTTNTMRIQSGAVTFPSGTLTVGGDFVTTGSGSFAHNNGEVVFLVASYNTASANGSSFNNVRVRGAIPTPDTRAFTDTNLTILGNFIAETGGDTLFPSGTMTIGGSFDNDADFNANSGTVLFNSSAGTETIAAGTSTFATVTFNNSGGIFTVTEHATATTAINLVSANIFTLNSGQSLTALGTFTNQAAAGSTTWAGSTLRLSSNTNYSINAKTHSGDTYGTLETTSDTDITMWNSSAASYVTASTSSIYSADHAGVDGDLNIYGQYERTTGTEHWSHATDFDGTALSATTSRQVDVRFANNATATFTGATLAILGTTTASTTINNQGSGTYGVSLTTATINARNYEFTNMNSAGLALLSSTTVTSLREGRFVPTVAGGSGITVAATTIDTNPGLQIFNVAFATTSAISAFNVSQIGGTPVSFWWFRNGTNNLYGEAFDNDTGDPGSVRFDDSSLSISVSGTVYRDAGVTPLTGGTCNGVATPVRLVVEGGATYNATCSNVNGSFTFPTVAIIGDPTVTIFLNDASGGEEAVLITKTPTSNITGADLYHNRLVVRHEDTAAMTIADINAFDTSFDDDLFFTAATGTTDSLVVFGNRALYIAPQKTFAPGGNVTLYGNASSSPIDGSLYLAATSTLTLTATATLTVGGSIDVGTNATITAASSTVYMNATTTGKTITATGGRTITFNELQFTGVGGGWNINTAIVAEDDIYVATGTVTGTGSVRLNNGSFYGDGLVSLGGGTTTIARTNTLGGVQGWTFRSLTLGNGSTTGTTTRASNATTTVSGVLTIATAHFLDANASAWNLSGTGTVLVESGTFLEDTSTVRYSGTGATNIRATDYHTLILDAAAGSPTYTALGPGIQVFDDLLVGLSNTTIVTFDTNDPALNVDGDFIIGTNGTFVASNSGSFTLAGSYDNNGTFTASGGTVTLDGASPRTIAAGNSSFASVLVNASGPVTVSEHATATAAFTLTNAGAFTLGSGQRLAVGGAFTNNLSGGLTTWTGSTLFLYGGGNYSVNGTSTSDSYETLSMGANTQVRLWNSSASSTLTEAGASVYSQDHANVNGDLYIFGDYQKTSGTDHWSHGTDFDGTVLGSPRVVNVRIEPSGTLYYLGTAGLSVLGTSTGSTTIEVQGSGTYSALIGGTASTSWQFVTLRDTNGSGLTFTGNPRVNTLRSIDFLAESNGVTTMTVGGSVITANPAKNFLNIIFNAAGGVSGATNVTATGTTLSAWRFTAHTGNLDGEPNDVDPGGDPGYLIWDDSASIITISGRVYQNDRITRSTVCDGTTRNIVLAIDGSLLQNASSTCSAADGSYSISGVSFSATDVLTLFINDETENGVAVSVDPVSSISDMDIYENHVIIRHENTDPISIADMAIYDSSDDADTIFTAVDASPDTLTIPANNQIIVWGSKRFTPGGNVTLSGGGAGASYDGTLELFSNATFDGAPGESHSVGGNLTTATGAAVQVDTASFTFTSSAASRTIDSNDTTFGNVTFNGSGSFTVTDTTFSIDDLSFTAGIVTLPPATTSVRGSLTTTGGSFINNGGAMNFTSSSTETIAANSSSFGQLYISGSGTFTMSDVNATATKSFRKVAGALTLPSGTFSVGGSFENASGTLAHNTSEIVLATSSVAALTASGSDLFAVRFTGGGTFTMTDTNLTLLDDLTITSGSLTLATGTLAVGGSWTTTGGTFTHASGTVLFNSTDGGETINPGTSNFNNISVAGPTGGFTFTGNATTTGNFALSSAGSFTVNSSVSLNVQGVFTNAVGGASTTWTGSTLRLLSGTDYSLNTKTTGGDVYGTLQIAALMNLEAWNSSAATTTLLSTSTASLYSRDHAGTDGHLYIFGTFTHATGTLFWNYANDFDGTVLVGGARRAVNVFMVTAASSSFAMSNGSLEMLGAVGATTTVQAVGVGSYSFGISGGTLNTQYYAFRNLNSSGLNLTGTPSITTLSNGDFELSQNGGTLISVSSTTLSANASKIFQSVRFATSSGVSGNNVTLSGTTLSSWRFQGSYGAIGGEAFDIDGIDACGSIRFDNSACLLVEQTTYRWRHDDGGLGVPNSEWYNASWSKRKSVRVDNNDATTYTDAVVKLTVLYDNDMQADFDDLRFTTNDGTTLISHFVASTTLSNRAEVWVKIPSLPASDTATIHMYYGNATASSTSSSANTFIAAEDFEDGNISEYSGNTSLFAVDGTFAYGGTYGLDNTGNENQRAADGIARFDQTVSQGETIRFEQYIDTVAGSGDEVCTLFAVQSPVTNNQNYAVCLRQFGVDRMSIVRNAENTDSTGTLLASTTVTLATGWYTVEIDWRTNNTIFASLFNRSGTLVATTSATDSTYTSGGIGFTYWFNYGGWDNYTSRPILANEPTTRFGLEVGNGGASWSAAQGVKGVYTTNDIARLRVAIENSGLAIIDQNFNLEFAPKGAAPSCDSVSGSNFVLVPNQASCGTSAICTQTTTYFTNGEATADLLAGTSGTATPGQAIESPSNTTSDIDIDANFFTEIEYALTPTSNASSTNYCFRVTDNSTALDSYLAIAELELSFGPQISALSLNGGLNITLTPGTTTTVYATGTVSDLNGYTDLTSATATIYRSGVGQTCTEDANNCYRTACSFIACAGNSCTLSCRADIVYHADATDIGAFAGETWRAFAIVSDAGNATTSDFAPSIDMFTLNALTLDGSSVINYGSLEVGTSTGGYNATTTVENIGNGNIDVSLQGTDLTDGSASTIAVNQQRFATSTFAYSSCVFCSTLATSTTPIEIDLFKPTSTSSPVLANIYWGIAIPFGTAATAHQGLNTFYAVTD